MSEGVVEGIQIAPSAGAPMEPLETASLVEGRGIEGDRYLREEGRWSERPEWWSPLTLIEAEAVEAAARDYEIDLEPIETRRNVVTRGIALNHLVGKEFRVGDVRLRGVRLCEPCGYLEGLTREGVRRALVHRGGLRADILEDGEIRVGDVVVAPEKPG